MTTKPLFGNVDRRQFMTFAGSATAALVAPVVLGSTPARAEDPITIFTWETYHEDAWIAEWTKATGIPVKVVRTGSVDEMFAQTQSGAIQADIIYIDSGSLKRYKDSNLIAPIDVSKIANAGNVTAGLKYPERNSIDGKLLGLPYNWGTQPLMFDESVVTSGTDSWGVLWDTKYKGKVNLFDDAYVRSEERRVGKECA